MATAGVWVDNTRKLYYFKKKKSQTYIHTWHAGPGLKRIERDAGSGLSKEYIAYAKKRFQGYRPASVQTADSGPSVLRAASGTMVRLWKRDFPKNDLYFQDQTPLRSMIRDYYHLPQDMNLVLYVPTWRENRKLNAYHLDFDGCIKAFEERFGGKWAMLVRMHPNVNAADFGHSLHGPDHQCFSVSEQPGTLSCRRRCHHRLLLLRI